MFAHKFYSTTHEHQFAESSRHVEGYLLDSNGRIVHTFPKGEADVVSMQTLLDLVGVSLDDPSEFANMF